MQEEIKRSIKLGDAQIVGLLDALDANGGQHSVCKPEEWSPGSASALTYRRMDIHLRVEHLGGGRANFRVPVRAIAPELIWFLHGGYLHDGTRCTLTLPTLWKGSDQITGVVRACKHVSGSVHEVDMCPQMRMDLRRYIEHFSSESMEHELIDPVTLVGEMLVLDPTNMNQMALGYQLRESRVNITAITEAPMALDEMKRRLFDIVVFCPSMLGVDVPVFVRTIRDGGFLGPILVLTGETNPTVTAAVRNAGATEIIATPYEPKRLLTLIGEHLRSAHSAGEPVYSALCDDPEAEELVDGYIRSVGKTVHQLNKAIECDDLQAVRSVCLALKETGGCYGFWTLSETADQAVKALDASMSIQESRDPLLRLEAMSKRLMPGRAPKSENQTSESAPNARAA